MPPTKDTFDAIIIGAGQSGMPLAYDLAEAGWSIALVERRSVGGTCINDGCTPTKTMVASARIAHLARRARDYGVNVGKVEINLSKVMGRKNSIVTSFRQGHRKRLEENHAIELIIGEASFLAPQTIRIRSRDEKADRHIGAATIIINSGTRPRRPTIPGLDSIEPLDSTSILKLDELPAHLIVLGGGYIGLEFGQMFSRFGSAVTIVQRGDQLLTREDPDVAAEVKGILESEGIRVLLNSQPNSVEPGSNGTIRLSMEDGAEFRTVEGSHLLLAVGRTPNTEALNLESAGVALDKQGYIQVDKELATTADGVFAMGDVKGGPAFTHISYDDYRVIRAKLLGAESRTTEGRMIPYTVFIDPQLGRVGLSEQQAERAGLNYKVASMPMSHVARAIELDETRGLMKAVVDGDNQQILGVAFLGIEGGELMSAAQLAMQGNLPYTELRDGIFAHPTLAESFNNLFAALE